MRIKLNDKVLVFNKEESHLVTASKKKFNVQSGMIDLGKLIGKNYGSKIKTHIGKDFILVKPTMLDMFSKFTRGAQVILPKDISLILAYTGVFPDSLVVDAGAGSAYLSIFLGNYLTKGYVVTYENDKRFIKISKGNIELSGLKNVKLKRKDISKGIDEKNVDLITLDLQDADDVLRHAYISLKIGGWLVVYSPTIDHLMRILNKIKKTNFGELKIIESVVREWQSEHTTRPKTMGLMHTGWLTFARKMIK